MSTAKATPLGTKVGCVRTPLNGQINQKFAALSIDEWLKRAKENHLCFGCFENTEWKTVNENDVVQNRKTEYRADIITVHKSNAIKIRVAAVSSGQGTLLPVTSASIFDRMECKRKERSFSILALKKAYPIEHYWATRAQRKGHLCDCSEGWRTRRNHKNKEYRVPVSSVDNHK